MSPEFGSVPRDKPQAAPEQPAAASRSILHEGGAFGGGQGKLLVMYLSDGGIPPIRSVSCHKQASLPVATEFRIACCQTKISWSAGAAVLCIFM